MARQSVAVGQSQNLNCHLLLLTVVATALSCQSCSTTGHYTVVNRFPHDTTAFTQGLVYSNGHLYESTGRLGLSQLRRVDLQTGSVLTSTDLAADRFGEGLALLNGRLYQLTWKSGIGYVYDAESLTVVDSFNYTGEGWGLATDGTHLIMSDGSESLRFLDPDGFELVREVTVKDKGLPLTQINELEYVSGDLYANIYPSDRVVQIDPVSGEVLNWFGLAGLLPDEERGANTDVLNGIALRAETGNLLVTGKLWPVVFEVRLNGRN